MKQYDLNGFQGEVSSFGTYFFFSVIVLLGIVSLYIQAYYFSTIIFIVCGILYYNSFTLGNRYRRIFFDEEFLYFDKKTIPLNRIVLISETGIIKYDSNGEIKKVLFVNFPRRAENFEILKNFYYKALEKKKL